MKKLIVGLSIAVGAILVVEAPAANATAWTTTPCAGAWITVRRQKDWSSR